MSRTAHTYYINGQYHRDRETVDQAETKKEAHELLNKYQQTFGPEWRLWVSPKPIKG